MLLRGIPFGLEYVALYKIDIKVGFVAEFGKKIPHFLFLFVSSSKWCLSGACTTAKMHSLTRSLQRQFQFTHVE